jgi:hypothetical protein
MVLQDRSKVEDESEPHSPMDDALLRRKREFTYKQWDTFVLLPCG